MIIRSAGRTLAHDCRSHNCQLQPKVGGLRIPLIAALLLALPTAALGIHGGQNDSNSPEANVVVHLSTNSQFGGGACTGTLITPRVVLTASHCVSGAEEMNTCSQVTSAARVGIGAAGSGTPGNVSPTFAVTRQMTSYLSRLQGCTTMRCHYGEDLALVFLDVPVLEEAHIVRPSLTSPKPDGDDDDGGIYKVPIGIAGWAPKPVDGPLDPITWANRQSLFFSQIELEHLSGAPPQDAFMTWFVCLAPAAGSDGQYWAHEHDSDDYGIGPGDSGGPLFIQRADGTRDPIGVLSADIGCLNDDCDMRWTDITRGFPADWIRNNVKDSAVGGGHTAKWRQRHGKDDDFWFGEVDYTGPCRNADDIDCDHWLDAHDNCRYVSNTDQNDSNDDGAGDVCQKCPWDPGNDADGDGVCAVVGPGQDRSRQDNCPQVANADQRNCNLWVEMMRQPAVDILGDACDPVPCPAVDATVAATTIVSATPWNPKTGGAQSGRLRYELTTTAVAPRARFMKIEAKYTEFGVPTTARFCQSNLALGFDCRAPQNIRDSAINDFPNAASEQLLSSKPWHRVTMTTDTVAGGENWTWNYDDGHPRLVWNYDVDWNRWWNVTPKKIPEPELSYRNQCTDTKLVGPGTCLDGTLWIHADTPVGGTVDFAQGNPAFKVGLHGMQLANRYLDIRPDEAFIEFSPGMGALGESQVAGGLWKTLPDPPPFLLDHRTLPQILVTRRADPGIYMLGSAGRLYPVTDLVSAEARRLMGSGSDAIWAEPVDNVSTGDIPGVQGFAVSRDATRILGSIVSWRGRIFTGRQFGHHIESPTAPAALAPRHNFITFSSQRTGTVFVVGGHDVRTDRPATALRIYRDSQGWSEVDLPGVHLEDIRAAVYSSSDSALWLLGRRSPGSDPRTLIRYDPWQGHVDTFRGWEELHGSDRRHFLAADLDGSVLLAIADPTRRRTKVLRLNRGNAGGLRSNTVEVLDGMLLKRPMVGPSAYQYVLSGEDGQPRVVLRSRMPSKEKSTSWRPLAR